MLLWYIAYINRPGSMVLMHVIRFQSHLEAEGLKLGLPGQGSAPPPSVISSAPEAHQG